VVNLPDQPPSFRPPSPAERPWWWRLENAAGEEVQADAESWVGETWSDLAAVGVDAVTLFEHDRQVYGPMSLHA
jgi:hypothetical protein